MHWSHVRMLVCKVCIRTRLKAVLSEVIYYKKAKSDLLIVHGSHCAGTVKGESTLILLCEKV